MLGDKPPPTGIEPRSSRFYAGALTARPLALVAEWLSEQQPHLPIRVLGSSLVAARWFAGTWARRWSSTTKMTRDSVRLARRAARAGIPARCRARGGGRRGDRVLVGVFPKTNIVLRRESSRFLVECIWHAGFLGRFGFRSAHHGYVGFDDVFDGVSSEIIGQFIFLPICRSSSVCSDSDKNEAQR